MDLLPLLNRVASLLQGRGDGAAQEAPEGDILLPFAAVFSGARALLAAGDEEPAEAPAGGATAPSDDAPQDKDIPITAYLAPWTPQGLPAVQQDQEVGRTRGLAEAAPIAVDSPTSPSSLKAPQAVPQADAKAADVEPASPASGTERGVVPQTRQASAEKVLAAGHEPVLQGPRSAFLEPNIRMPATARTEKPDAAAGDEPVVEQPQASTMRREAGKASPEAAEAPVRLHLERSVPAGAEAPARSRAAQGAEAPDGAGVPVRARAMTDSQHVPAFRVAEEQDEPASRPQITPLHTHRGKAQASPNAARNSFEAGPTAAGAPVRTHIEQGGEAFEDAPVYVRDERGAPTDESAATAARRTPPAFPVRPAADEGVDGRLQTEGTRSPVNVRPQAVNDDQGRPLIVGNPIVGDPDVPPAETDRQGRPSTPDLDPLHGDDAPDNKPAVRSQEATQRPLGLRARGIVSDAASKPVVGSPAQEGQPVVHAAEPRAAAEGASMTPEGLESTARAPEAAEAVPAPREALQERPLRSPQPHTVVNGPVSVEVGAGSADGQEDVPDRGTDQRAGLPRRTAAAQHEAGHDAAAPPSFGVEAAPAQAIREEASVFDAAPAVDDEPDEAALAGAEPGPGHAEAGSAAARPESAVREADRARTAEAFALPGRTLPLAWLRTVLTNARGLATTRDGWKVLEMNLEEGEGTVTIKARREEGRMAVSVGFSDPNLRALAAAHADRLHQALQAEYETTVDLSLFNGDGAGSHRQQQAEDSAGPRPAAAHPAGADTLDEAPVRRARGAGARHEWIG